MGVGVADVVKALVLHVGIATVWVRVQAASTKKGHRMCPNSPKKIQTTLEHHDVY